MDVRKLLEEVKRGDISIEEAENAFKNLPYEDLGYAKLDLHRLLRAYLPRCRRLCRLLRSEPLH